VTDRAERETSVSDVTDRAERETSVSDVTDRADPTVSATAEALRATLTDLFGIAATDVRPDATLEADLALDSLSVVELQVALEETLGVRIDVADPSEVRTVADLQGVLDRAVERGEPPIPTLHLVADEPAGQ